MNVPQHPSALIGATLPVLPTVSPLPNTPPSPTKPYHSRLKPRYKLTLLGRCVALLAAELLANAAVWTAAGIVFGRSEQGRAVLSLCVVAWTLGLRHGLDMDHIVAIDNVTRNLVSMGQLPVTVGLFFSVGHSSIVIGMTIAIIITVSAIDKVPDISNVGGVIGVCVSASFLFLLALINSVVLFQSIRLARRRRQAKQLPAADTVPIASTSSPLVSPSLAPENVADDPSIAKPNPDPPTKTKLDNDDEEDERTRQEKMDREREREREREVIPGLPATTCIARIGRPLFRLIDRPWKMYPVGILFGFGFDTASEISLLGVSALAKGTHHIPSSTIILLPLLFTAGMSLVDSLDSVFMLSAYTVPQARRRWSRGRGDAEGKGEEEEREGEGEGEEERERKGWWKRRWVLFENRGGGEAGHPEEADDEGINPDSAEDRAARLPMPDPDKLLNISVVLTIISIVVALLISITEFMGLALEKCPSCSEAAETDQGLSGSWWRFWSSLNDNSGYLGAGVIGLFVVVFGGWGVGRWWNGRKMAQGKRRGRG
ncbi:hypothetical protein JCM11641_002080 [Rhodosporidiobolus odoratus]